MPLWLAFPCSINLSLRVPVLEFVFPIVSTLNQLASLQIQQGLFAMAKDWFR